MNYKVMEFSDIKQEAKDALRGNHLMLLLALIVVSVIGFAASKFYIAIIIFPLLEAGIYFVIKHILWNKQFDFDRMLAPFKSLNLALKLIGVYFLTALIVILGLFLFIIPGIIFAFQYAMAPYIMMDRNELGVMEALNESKETMRGYKWNFFVFNLSFIGHFVLLIITLGLYSLYLGPYFQTSIVNYYLYLSGQETKPKLIEENTEENEEF